MESFSEMDVTGRAAVPRVCPFLGQTTAVKSVRQKARVLRGRLAAGAASRVFLPPEQWFLSQLPALRD